MTELPPRLEALAKRLNDTQTNALGAVDVLWREEIAPLVEALEHVRSKQGFCIYGTADLAPTPEDAFRQGSAHAFADLAGVASDALERLERGA